MDQWAEKRRKYQKEIDEMCLMDDNFMSAVLQDKACCELVIHTILERTDIEVIECKTQHSISNLYGRSVRLDILARDSKGEFINIEVQRNDKGADPKRARYHGSIIDANISEPGKEFAELPETYIIFITENDIFKENRPIYTINRIIAESGSIFDDGMHIIYVNSRIQNDTALGKLMHDFYCRNPKEMYYDVLSDNAALTKEREDEKGMCKIIDDIVQRERKEAAKEATKQATKQASIETACRMLEDGMTDITKIARYSNLTIDEVKELMQKHSA